MVIRHQVSEVIETNDCTGRKNYVVVCQEGDEQQRSYFSLPKGFLYGDNRLILSTVARGDIIEANPPSLFDELFSIGEFHSIVDFLGPRYPTCECGAMLSNTGSDLYCPNNECYLTVTARIEQLSRLEMMHIDRESPPIYVPDWALEPLSKTPTYVKPFLCFSAPQQWGNYQKLSDVVRHINRTLMSIDVAQFYNEDVLSSVFGGTDFIRSLPAVLSHKLGLFYGLLEEVIERRDYNLPDQNYLVMQILESLGIPGLSAQHIDQMVRYEMLSGHSIDPFGIHAGILTRPQIMIHELGWHPLNANLIYMNVQRMAHHLYAVFETMSHYQDVQSFFIPLLS